MTALKTRLVTTALLAAFVSAVAQAAEASPGQPLDGKSFHGSIRATGLLGMVKRQGTLHFKNGTVRWHVADGKEDYEPAPYKTTKANGKILFKARMFGKNRDFIDWSGSYDGKVLRDVKAVWTRAKGDFVHDLLLPDVVTLRFKPQ